MKDLAECSTVVWEQLLRLAESGDLRAIKLYYEMLEKKQRKQKEDNRDNAFEMEQMAEIRRAVFGADAVIRGSTDDEEAEDII